MEATALLRAAEVLRQGGIVAYPTEAMYALAADVRREDAVARLRELKSREPHKPLALLVADTEHLYNLVQDVSPAANVLMRTFWPGPLTLIFNARPGLSGGITAQTGTVAVRCTRHPVAAGLVRALGGAITATGCDVRGGRAVRNLDDVGPLLRQAVDLVLEGEPAPAGGPCTVVDARLDSAVVVRDGLVSQADVERALGVALSA